MKIRFGMLATDAYGKAGGQAIQRRGSIRVLRNITIPTQRISSRQNPQRSISSLLFNGWSFLARSEREMWSEVGANLSAVNGWGEEKTFSGRQAYTKLNGIAFVKTNALIDPSEMQYEVPFFIASPFVIVALLIFVLLKTTPPCNVSTVIAALFESMFARRKSLII